MKKTTACRIAILMTLSTLVATSVFSMFLACALSGTGWPFLCFCVSLSALVPLLGCGLGEQLFRDGDSSALYTSGFDQDPLAEARWTDLGWVVFGVLLLSGFACPLVMAQGRLISIGVAWATAVSSWATAAFIVISLVFVSRGSP